MQSTAFTFSLLRVLMHFILVKYGCKCLYIYYENSTNISTTNNKNMLFRCFPQSGEKLEISNKWNVVCHDEYVKTCLKKYCFMNTKMMKNNSNFVNQLPQANKSITFTKMSRHNCVILCQQ